MEDRRVPFGGDLGRDPAIRRHPVPGRRPRARARPALRRDLTLVPGRALRARPAQRRARRPQPHAGRGRLRRGRGDLPPLAGGGMLEPDASPAVYVLEQSFADGGRTLRRFGLLARFRAEDPERRIILPHEQTRAAAKEDRWRMLQATRANFSPIFLMFPDPRRALRGARRSGDRPPAGAQYTDDGGVGHRLWRVDRARPRRPLPGAARRREVATSRTAITATRRRCAIATRPGPTAPGRSATSRRSGRPGLVVLPYHRILSEGPSLDEAARRLGARFRLTRRPDVAAGGVRGRPPRPRPTPSRSPSRGGARSWPRPSRGAERCSRRRPRPACAPSTPTSCTRPCSGRCSASRTRR